MCYQVFGAIPRGYSVESVLARAPELELSAFGDENLDIEPRAWRYCSMNLGFCSCENGVGTCEYGVPENWNEQERRLELEAQGISGSHLRRRIRKEREAIQKQLRSDAHRKSVVSAKAITETILTILRTCGLPKFGMLMVDLYCGEGSDQKNVIVREHEITHEVILEMKENTLYVFAKDWT